MENEELKSAITDRYVRILSENCHIAVDVAMDQAKEELADAVKALMEEIANKAEPLPFDPLTDYYIELDEL